MTVCPAKTQISLGIRPVWSESSLCAQWVVKDPSFLHAGSEDSFQTGRMPRLIWVFAGRTCHFVGFVVMRLNFCSVFCLQLTVAIPLQYWTVFCYLGVHLRVIHDNTSVTQVMVRILPLMSPPWRSHVKGQGTGHRLTFNVSFVSDFVSCVS